MGTKGNITVFVWSGFLLSASSCGEGEEDMLWWPGFAFQAALPYCAALFALFVFYAARHIAKSVFAVGAALFTPLFVLFLYTFVSPPLCARLGLFCGGCAWSRTAACRFFREGYDGIPPLAGTDGGRNFLLCGGSVRACMAGDGRCL